MSKRKKTEAAEVVAAKGETMAENPKRTLLEAYLPDGLPSDSSNRILDGLGLLGNFLPEEVLRVQASAVLLILEQQYQILEELRSLKGMLGSLPVQSSEGASTTLSNGSEPVAGYGSYEGIDFLYFRELIMQKLGVDPGEETLETLAQLAGNPARLERAIVYTQRVMEEQDLESPVGFLIAKLRSWYQQDSEKRQRQRQRRW